MKSPLVDVAAILMCALLIVLIGQYYIHKKDKEMSLQQIENRVELKEQPKVEKKERLTFAQAVKVTE